MKAEENTDEVKSALAQLDFLKGSLRSILVWPAICILVGILVWFFALSQLSAEKEKTREQAFHNAQSLSKSYAEQLSRTVEQLDQITLNLVHYWRASNGTLKLEEQANQGLYPENTNISIGIFDKDGKAITTLLQRPSDLRIADRNYFQAHKNGLVSGLHVEKLAKGRILGKPIVIFSRALTDQDGRFDGVIYVGVEPAFLAAFYDKVAEGENDALVVVTKEGEFIASKMGTNIQQYGTLAKRAAVFDKPQGILVVPADQFMDARPRIVAWKMLDKYPFVSVVALSESDAYASYEALRDKYMGMAAGASILLSIIGVMGSGFSGRLAWRKYQATIITETYRLAIEGAKEGFFMGRALFGHDHAISDFVVEKCNDQGAHLLGLSKEQLIGVRFSQLYAGKVFKHLMPILCTAMDKGFYEDEFAIKSADEGSRLMHRRMVRSGSGIAITLRDITEAKAHQQALECLANTDALTRLPNRHWLSMHLPKSLVEAQLEQKRVAVLYLDLDNFKDVNNTMGHAAGDELLCQAGQRMQSVVRPGDYVVRLGGDEFTVLLPSVDTMDDAARIATRIHEVLSKPFQIATGVEHVVRASIGISLFPEDGQTGETLLTHADTAMYSAKNKGKGQYAFYTPVLTSQIVSRISKENALRHAVDAKQFVLYYQPRVNAATGELKSMEALVRWMHPEIGIVPPMDFIPLAEETGLIVEIGEFVIDQACAQIAAWKKQQLGNISLSVNVSPKQFAHGNLRATLADSITRHGISASLLEIEITESCMLQDGNKVAADIAAIKQLGIRISVDDFGTGYSCLSQLQRLDIDVLKVDRAFTSELINGKHGQAFFMTIVSMAQILDMEVVAEGVETLEQLTILQELGCNEIQGFFISRPVPAHEAGKLLVQQSLFQHSCPKLHVV